MMPCPKGPLLCSCDACVFIVIGCVLQPHARKQHAADPCMKPILKLALTGLAIPRFQAGQYSWGGQGLLAADTGHNHLNVPESCVCKVAIHNAASFVEMQKCIMLRSTTGCCWPRCSAPVQAGCSG